ncbi:hypothetical protein K439DRAFT_1618949 [Ramaria rubella]|nr:hypothetical protein K439DRAFT_1618949 [Ramaria rubella]
MYFQHDDGYICKFCSDEAGNKWTKGTALFKAKLDTPLTSIAWMQGGTHQFCIYYLDNSNVIQEYCNDGNKWCQGSKITGESVYSSTSLAAETWQDGTEGTIIHVYYQHTDNKLPEVVNGGGWKLGKTFSSTDPLVGTKLSVFRTSEKASLHLFYQANDSYIHKTTSESGWGDTDLKIKPLTNTSLASFQIPDNGIHLEASYNDSDKAVQLFRHTETGKWETLAYTTGTKRMSVDTKPICTTFWKDSSKSLIAILVKKSEGKVDLLYYDRSDWESVQTLQW